jgi:hypothetical protein
MSDVRSKQEEIDRNFEFFQSELPRLIVSHRNKFVLIRDRVLTGFYDTPEDALTAASQLFPDGLYSIQMVADTVGDLGFYSHAMHLGAT